MPESSSDLSDALPKSGTPSAPQATLGTFIGVFTPTILTILGVMMYRRFGWVVGSVDLAGALVILLIAHAITISTTLSFSAIATNTRVGVGGAYYIISRSLGLEIGGAIGIPLFLSQVASVTVYGFGIAEALQILVPSLPLVPTTMIIIVAVGLFSLKGADWALRSQIPIMVFIAISIAALAAGVASHGQAVASPELAAHMTQVPREGFWVVFAVFFPAVTGVMAGLGLSGDLKDPRRSIPVGSLGAVLTGFAIYLGLLVLLYQAGDAAVLRADAAALQGAPHLMHEIFDWSRVAVGGAWVIFPGMLGAIFSSAVGSVLGAPRTLQAMAADHTKPDSSIGRLAGADSSKEPVAGLILSVGLALAAVSLGDLNAVSQVVTLLFLTVYGAVNMVAALETLAGSATWRPTLKAPWPVSLAAGVGCFAVMFVISWEVALAAITLEIGLWFLFRRMERSTDWGDMRRDLYEALIRWALIRLKTRPMTARNWRPHIMVFARNIASRLGLVRLANDFSQGRGVVTVCELLEGDILERDRLDLQERTLRNNKMLDDAGVVAFAEVNVAQDFQRGVVHMAQANGMAGLNSNMVMFGWPDEPERLAKILSISRSLESLNKSMVIAKPLEEREVRQGKAKILHIWWGGLQRNGDLMLVLAYFLSRNPGWRRAQIEVIGIASNEVTQSELSKQLEELLPEARIHARTRVITKPKDLSIRDIILRESARADGVFLGLGMPPEGEELAYAERMFKLSAGLKSTYFVKNASEFSGQLI